MFHKYPSRLRALGEAFLRLAECRAAAGSDGEEQASSDAFWDAVRRYPPIGEAISNGTDEEDAVLEALWESWKALLADAASKGSTFAAAGITAMVIVGWWTGSFPEGSLSSVSWWGVPAVLLGGFVWCMRRLRRLFGVLGETVDRRWSFAMLLLSLANPVALVALGLGILATLYDGWFQVSLTDGVLVVVGVLFGYLAAAARGRR